MPRRRVVARAPTSPPSLAATPPTSSAAEGPTPTCPPACYDRNLSLQASETLMNLPPPFAGVAQLRARLAAKVFDVHVMMTLPGTHTIGRSHCLSFTGRPVLL
jgi:hypothetical protein